MDIESKKESPDFIGDVCEKHHIDIYVTHDKAPLHR